jgi:hypothetical protein
MEDSEFSNASSLRVPAASSSLGSDNYGGRSILAQGGIRSSSSSRGMTMAEKLAEEYAAAEAAGRQLTAVQQRQEKRKAVLEQSKQVG